MNFQDFLITIGKSEKTAKNYYGAVKGVMSSWAAERGWAKQSLLEIEDLLSFEILANKIRKLAIYDARNTVGRGMYNAALCAYSDYLAETKGERIEQDIAAILNDSSVAETEKMTLVSARIGQGKYRKSLVAYWGGCSATGYKNCRLLAVSHIKPWRFSSNRERLDVNNGLLLLPNLDKAFDLGFITFSSKGSIWISSELEQPEVLGVDPSLGVCLQDFHHPYMDYHRELIFRR